jgi:hypothetical protein
LEQVFSGTIDYSLTNPDEWITIEFDEPFVYTGGNMVFAMLNNDGTYLTCVNAMYYNHTTTETKTLHYRKDGTTPIDLGDLPNATGIITDRNHVKLNICGEFLGRDLQALSINGELNIKVGETHYYTVTVKNAGEKTTNKFNVKIMTENNEILNSINVNDSLAPEATSEISIPVTFTEFMVGELNIKGYVDIVGDQNPENNETPIVSLHIDNLSFTIVAAAMQGGSINPSGNIIVALGANQTFEMVPDDDYKIKDVIVNGISEGKITFYTFSNVQNDATIDVFFEPIVIINEKANATFRIFISNNVVYIINENLIPIKQIEVFDVFGRRQKAESRKGEEEKGEVVMDISDLQVGIYFVKIITDKGVITKKIIKY